jgi:predicted dehydrogenase
MLTAAVVGVGTPPGRREPGALGQGYQHAWGYRRSDGVTLVACADVADERARRFGTTFGLASERVYADHEALLEDHAPDLVSVCTPPESHERIIEACIAADVTAVHCEKPLAPTWGACQATAADCAEQDVVLTVNHQRRFVIPIRRAKRLIAEREVGRLERVAFHARNLFDYGVHLFDLCGYVTDQAPVAWVDATIEYEVENRFYGLHNENRGLAHWRYENGVTGVAATGSEFTAPARMELVGTEGRIQIEPTGGPALRVGDDGQWRRVRGWGDRFDGIDPWSIRGLARRVARNLPWDRARRLAPAGYTERGIVNLVEALRTDRDPVLSADQSLAATEVAFACYASASRGERVSLPLDIEHNPLERMVAEGELDPSSAD